MTTKGKTRPLAFDGGGILGGMTPPREKSLGILAGAVSALGLCTILTLSYCPSYPTSALRDASCPPAQATHEMVCGETVMSVRIYKNGGYVCAEYGGVVELGDNCTLLPLRPGPERNVESRQ